MEAGGGNLEKQRVLRRNVGRGRVGEASSEAKRRARRGESKCGVQEEFGPRLHHKSKE